MKNHAQLALGAFFTALVSAAFAISYAAIIYTGPLAEFLERGIGLALLGAVVISLVGAFSLSYRGSILGPQDLPAILIASGAAAVAAQSSMPPDVLFATVASLVALTALVTGGLGLAIGQLRLAYIARFIPYPVLAGFLATTGLFLFLGGIDVGLGPAQAVTWGDYFTPDLMARWGPVVGAAIAMTVATRMLAGYLVLPLTLIAALLALYAFYALIGIGPDALMVRGFLLGPFREGGFAGSLDPRLPMAADWAVIAGQAPLILTTALSALIGTALNASGLELALKRDFDFNRELKANGLANLISGLFGGIPGYHVVGKTLLANRLGLTNALAGISAAAGCALVLVLGAGALGSLPVGFFAAVIAFLGVDLLYSWLWAERKRLGWRDYAIVLFIPLIAVSYGFLTAIAIGLLLACVLFIMEYRRLKIFRFESDLSTRRSLVERPDTELAVLAERGNVAKVIELSSYLFFGSSGVLRRRVGEVLAQADGIEWLILDFKNVPGIDVSTRHILRRIEDDCANAEVHLIFTGLPNDTLGARESEGASSVSFATLADGIQHIEENLLTGHVPRKASTGAQVRALFAAEGLGSFTQHVTLEKGAHVLEEAAASSDIYVLLSGLLRVVTGSDQVIAYIRPGAFVGEMAYYSGRERSAAIIADDASKLLRIDSTKLSQLEHEHPQIAAQFHRLVAKDMARRLTRTTNLLRDLGV
ncbi:MAG: SulP family inorganic anion transporter [Pseudomonadota bacterium]